GARVARGGRAALGGVGGGGAWKHQASRPPLPVPAPAIATPAAATTPALTPPTTAPPTRQPSTSEEAPRADRPQAEVPVLVRSDPPGARVAIDGKPVGAAPLSLSIALPSDLVLSLPGYRPVRRHVATAGTVNVRLLTLHPAPTPRLLDE